MQDLKGLFDSVQQVMALYGLNIVSAVLIFVVGRWLAKFLRNLTIKLLTKKEVEPTLVTFVGHLTYVLLMTFVAVATIGKLGVQTTSIIAVLGAAGLAVGLALQGSLANFAAGVLLIMFRPFRVGDYIDGAGVSGTVEEINIFTTQLRSPDNKTIIVPNSKLSGDNLINYSAKEVRRVDMTFGVSYSDDLDMVKEVISNVLSQDERILKDPAPQIALMELADSSVNFVVRPWVKTSDYWGVYFDINERMKKRFDAEGITIPFPQRDMHVFQHTGPGGVAVS